MRYICATTLFYLSSAVTSILSIGLNHLLLKLNISQLDLNTLGEKWFDVPLDNFNPQDRRTFKMRYFDNLNFWKPGGPIYILIGGEDTVSSFWITGMDFMFIVQMAKETNGAMFATEHRYYGSSLPNIPKNDKIAYYKYLSSRQTLADIADFIMKMKSDPKYRWSKVVVVGCSYGGSLATWVRALYPQLVDAAVAMSAPVLAKKNFYEYLDGVRYTFGQYGTENCLHHIEKKFKRYEDYLKTKIGRELIKQTLNLDPSYDLTVLQNQQSVFNRLYSPLMWIAQYGSSSEVKQTCNTYYRSFSNNSTLDLLNVFRLTTSLVDSDSLNVDSTRETANENAWRHQYCTEFGYLKTTSSEHQPFVHWNPLEYCLTLCNRFVEGDIEKRIDEGVARTNAMYGGRTPKVSKVVFTHGDMDPWAALGVVRDLGPDAPAFVIQGTAHCALLTQLPEEPKELTEVRNYIKDLIKKWISTS